MADQHTPNAITKCPACGVVIEHTPNGDRVLFSFGKPGTRERLAARVCQFARKPGCINKGVDLDTVPAHDFYLEPKDLHYRPGKEID